MSTFGTTGAPAIDFISFGRSFDVVEGPMAAEGVVRVSSPLISSYEVGRKEEGLCANRYVNTTHGTSTSSVVNHMVA